MRKLLAALLITAVSSVSFVTTSFALTCEQDDVRLQSSVLFLLISVKEGTNLCLENGSKYRVQAVETSTYLDTPTISHPKGAQITLGKGTYVVTRIE